jgi:hypothetical protein
MGLSEKSALRTVEAMKMGDVSNRSSKTLLVIERETGQALTHCLYSGYDSPGNVDADGVKALDGTPIHNHTSWWKVSGPAGATIIDTEGGGLDIARTPITISPVKDDEFGPYSLESEAPWGTKARGGCCLGLVLGSATGGVAVVGMTVHVWLRRRTRSQV